MILNVFSITTANENAIESNEKILQQLKTEPEI
jgi:hypothetical protein